MSDNEREIRTRDLLRVFWRSFLIQASWSYDRMQSLGFAFAIQPVLKRLYPDREEYRSRLNLHMHYFNTQPYLASFILGATAKIEEERATGRNRTTDVEALKSALMAPLGALGDSFFWGALKPLAAVSAAAVILTGSWWGPLLFLILYNAWHIRLRRQALLWGYHSAGDGIDLIARYSFTKMARLFKALCLSLIGGILGTASAWRSDFKPTLAVPGLVVGIAALLITLVLVEILKKGASPVKLMLALAVMCLALAYAGVDV